MPLAPIQIERNKHVSLTNSPSLADAPEDAHATIRSHYEGVLRTLLAEVRSTIAIRREGDGALIQRIDEVLARPAARPYVEHDLVWERLPSGEFAWLNADMTGPRR